LSNVHWGHVLDRLQTGQQLAPSHNHKMPGVCRDRLQNSSSLNFLIC
jgi:hypothetical protein